MAEDNLNYFQRLFKKKIETSRAIDEQFKDVGFEDEQLASMPAAIQSSLGADEISPRSQIIKSAKQSNKILNFNAPEKPVTSDIDSVLKNEIFQGNLPELPQQTIDLIKSGKLTVDKVKEMWAERSAEYLKINVDEFKEARKQGKELVTNLIANDELPLDEKVIKRLNQAPNEIQNAVDAYDEYKKSMDFYEQPELLGDKIKAMKGSGFDTSKLEEKYKEELSRSNFYFQKFVQGASMDIFGKDVKPMYWADEIGGPITYLAGNIASFAALEKAVAAGLTKISSKVPAVLEKTAEAATLAAEKTKSLPTVSRILKSAASTFESGSKLTTYGGLTEKAAKARSMQKEMYMLYKTNQELGMTMEAEKALEAVNKFRSAAQKSDLIKLAATQAGVGATVGTAKGIKQYATGEENLNGAIVTALTDTIAYPLAALALVPASRVIGKLSLAEMKAFGGEAGKAGAEFIEGTGTVGASTLFPSVRRKANIDAKLLTDYLTNDQVKAIAANGVPESLIGKLTADSLEPEFKMAFNSLAKINIMKAAVGDASEGIGKNYLISQPKLMDKVFAEQMSNAADSMFKGESAPLASLYNSSDNIKSLVDSGLPLNALDSAKSEMAMQIHTGNLKPIDMMDGAFPVDKDMMTELLTDKVIGSSMPSTTKEQKRLLRQVPKQVKAEVDRLLSLGEKVSDEQISEIEQSLKDKILSTGKQYTGVKGKYADRKEEMWNAVYKYIDNPNEQTVSELEQVANAPKKITSKKGVVYESGKPRVKFFKNVMDEIERAKVSQLNADEVNKVINQSVHGWFKEASGGQISSTTSKYFDAEQLISAMTVQNQNLMETTIEAFERSALLNNQHFFTSIEASEAKALRSALKIRDMEYELGTLMQSYDGAKSSLDEILKSKDADVLQIADHKSKLKSYLSRQSELRREIGENKTIIDSFNTKENPNYSKEIFDKAADIWSPHMSMYRKPGMSMAEVTDNFLSTEGVQKVKDVSQVNRKTALDNVIDSLSGKDLDYTIDPKTPYAIRNKTALQKELAWFMASGKDFKNTYTKVGFKNVARALQAELGEQSAIHNFLVNGYKEREIAASNLKKQLFSELKEIGIKSGTVESRLVHELGEKFPTTYKNNDRFLALNLSQQEKVEKGIQWFRKTYDNLIQKMNDVNIENGNLEVSFRENYFPHFKDKDELMRVFKEFASGLNKEYNLVQQRVGDPNGPVRSWFRHSMRRTGDDTVYDAVKGFESYVDGAARVINFSDYLRQVDAMMNFAPENFRELLKHIKEVKVLGGSSLDNSFFEKNSAPKRVIKFLDNVITKGTLAFKITTAASQISSSAFAFSESTPEAISSVLDLSNRFKSKSVNSILEKSKNLAIRNLHMGGMDDLKSPTGSFMKFLFGETSDKTKLKNLALDTTKIISKASMWAADHFDKSAVKHIFLSTYKRGIKIGMSEDAAVRMADYAADKFHGDLSKMGRAAYQNSMLGRAATRFSTFTNNLFTGLLTDLPRIEQRNGTAAMVNNVLKLAAAMEITNEVYSSVGMPKQFETSSLIPFVGTAKYGMTGVGDFVKDVALEVVKRDNRTDKNMVNDLFNIAGISQIVKGKKAVSKLIDGEYDDPSSDSYTEESAYKKFISEFVLGEKQNEYRENEIKKRKNKESDLLESEGFKLTEPRIEIKKKLKSILRSNDRYY